MAVDPSRRLRGVLCVRSAQFYGEQYNAVRDEVFTWRDYYRELSLALDTRAKVIFVPTNWLVAQAPQRFEFLSEISRHHGAFSSAKARAHVPEFKPTIGLETGARQTFADLRARGAWPDSTLDTEYQAVVERVLALGLVSDEP